MRGSMERQLGKIYIYIYLIHFLLLTSKKPFETNDVEQKCFWEDLVVLVEKSQIFSCNLWNFFD
jgi:hypothetical protein